MSCTLRSLGQSVSAPNAGRGPGGDDDGALLGRFAAGHDGEAFAELVRRRGPVVMGVCRRVLGQPEDAEDVFQATFLVLAREAAAVRRRWGAAVGGWLYGTAYRLALRARRAAARRRRHESASARPAFDAPADGPAAAELDGVLDRELNALPRRYRQPLVLCYFAGLTQDEAAGRLRLHPRSLERRLKVARALLHKRLSRRGVTASAAVLAVALCERSTAAVPEVLAARTAGAAAANVATGATAGLSAAAVVLAGRHRLARTLWWVYGSVAAATLLCGLAAWWWWSERSPEPAPVVVGAAPAKPATGPSTVTVRGRVADPGGSPMPGVTVLVLSRPVRLYRDGSWEPIYDPLTAHRIRKGHFRELARGTTDADGRYHITATLKLPDPTTGAAWFQTLPFVVSSVPFRLEDQAAEFTNMQIRTP